MNYRHAFHAGNASDCMKHALLVWIMGALLRKPAPVFVLDTHAGLGTYDLLAGPATRTGEWQGGIGRLLQDPPPALQDFTALVGRLGLYPGSPALVRAMMRERDRLVCCELHPDDCAVLRRWASHAGQVGVHLRDGYAALGALLPPRGAQGGPFTRGLVLIDPPYEAPGEFERVQAGLITAAGRWPQGVLAAWYPIKHRSPVTTFHEGLRLSGLSDVVVAELHSRAPTDPQRLNGCGLVVRNAPFGFMDAAGPVLDALLTRLGNHEPGAGTACWRLTNE